MVTQAVELLQNGALVALPTETVYGLAASITSEEAIEKIFLLKGRPASNPLILHVTSVEEVSLYTTAKPPEFELLAKHFWPGPLTLVLPADCRRTPSRLRAGLPTIAVRIPDHPLTLEVIRAVGPLVMPSANRSGRPSATCPAHVAEDFGSDFPCLDGGSCQKGVESTILGLEAGRFVLLRRGAITEKQIAGVIGYEPALFSGGKLRCPGQLFRHYAPRATLLFGRCPQVEAIVGFSDRTYPAGSRLFSLGSAADGEGAARRLYGVLRALDKQEVRVAWVDRDFPDEGIWRTLHERLERAAAAG